MQFDRDLEQVEWSIGRVECRKMGMGMMKREKARS